MQRRIYGREIDAPQVTVPVAVEALKDHPAGKPVCHPRLHYGRGTQVRDEAPDGLGLRPIAVVPPAVRGQAHRRPAAARPETVASHTLPNCSGSWHGHGASIALCRTGAQSSTTA